MTPVGIEPGSSHSLSGNDTIVLQSSMEACCNVFEAITQSEVLFHPLHAWRYRRTTVSFIEEVQARKCSSFSRASQSHKYACAELKKELLPVCTKICFYQVFFANLRDIRAQTKRTNMPKEGKNYTFSVNQAIFRKYLGQRLHFCMFMLKFEASQNILLFHDKTSVIRCAKSH